MPSLTENNLVRGQYRCCPIIFVNFVLPSSFEALPCNKIVQLYIVPMTKNIMDPVLCATALIFLNNSINYQYLQLPKEHTFPFTCFVRVFVCFRTIVLIVLFSQYLSKVEVPVPGYNKERGNFYVGRFPLFRLFPVSRGSDIP